MKGLFYEFLVRMSRLTGPWFVALFAWLVSSGFFLFRPGMVARNVSFFRSVFPEKGFPAILGIVLRQFHHFATVFADRVRLARNESFTWEVAGMEGFKKHTSQGRGGIFLMSHFGNWEIAARLFARKGFPLVLHLGEKQKEQIERKQKRDLARDGVQVVSASAEGGSPFDLLESVRVLREGGFVSIAGDRIQSEGQRRVEALFFGRKVNVPVAPHLLAMKAGVPIFTLFTVRLNPLQYKILLGEPYFVARPGARESREEALRRSVAHYLGEVEEMVRKHPEHWYRFDT
jgi:KDO2-lipid IV(A) lauroyltransferase